MIRNAFLAAAALLLCACEGSPPANAQAAMQNYTDLALTGRVVDSAQIIPAETERRIAQRSAALEKETTDQLVVVTLKSLEGQPIERVALELGNRWGVGRADLDNGVMLIVAPKERKVRIEVGLGLEGLLTDDRAGIIIRQMIPMFTSGQPVEAIENGVAEIDTVLRSDRRRPQYKMRKAA